MRVLLTSNEVDDEQKKIMEAAVIDLNPKKVQGGGRIILNVCMQTCTIKETAPQLRQGISVLLT